MSFVFHPDFTRRALRPRDPAPNVSATLGGAIMTHNAFGWRSGPGALAVAALFVTYSMFTGCSRTASPEAPTATAVTAVSASDSGDHAAHIAAAPEDHGLIDGWFEGSTVHLYYTKSYFCAEPPLSGAPSGCEIGAPADIAPR